MGSFTAEQLDKLLRLFRLPLGGSHKSKEERIKKFLNPLDPDARFAPPNCKCPEPDDDDDDPRTPPPRNTPLSPSSRSAIADSPPTENTSGPAEASTHPSTAETPSGTQNPSPGKRSGAKYFPSRYIPPILMTRPPTWITSAHAASSTHPSSGETSGPRRSSSPRHDGRPFQNPSTTRSASTAISERMLTSITHTPTAAISSAQNSPPEASPNPHETTSSPSRRNKFSGSTAVVALGRKVEKTIAIINRFTGAEEDSVWRRRKRPSHEKNEKGKEVAEVAPVELSGEETKEEEENAPFARHFLWETSKNNGKGKEVVRFHPEEDVSETEGEFLEGKEEDDRIWEALRPESPNESIESVEGDYEDHLEFLRMWKESAGKYNKNLFGRDISHEETTEKIYRTEVLA